MHFPRDLPTLRDPVMIAAFSGWNDAADAASLAVEHLEAEWSAATVAELDGEDYYDFQVNRPTIAVDDTGVRTVDWPTTRISACALPGEDRDVVLVRGIEPSMRWRSFCTELTEVAGRLGVRRVVTLAALLADTPHSRPVPVHAVAPDSATAERLGVEQSRYEGPTGIVGVLQDAYTRAGFEAVALWAAVPHYVAQPPCPKATLALLHRVEDHLDLRAPLGDLADEARAWQLGVDELAAEDPDVGEYVRRLEEQQEATDLPEASGEAIAREFERYLRRRPDS